MSFLHCCDQTLLIETVEIVHQYDQLPVETVLDPVLQVAVIVPCSGHFVAEMAMVQHFFLVREDLLPIYMANVVCFQVAFLFCSCP